MCAFKNAMKKVESVSPNHMEHKYVTREEFDIYETLKSIAVIDFFIAAKLIFIGKCGKWMTWCNKAGSTKWLQKKSCFCLMILILLSIYNCKEGSHIKHVLEKIKHQKSNEIELQQPAIFDPAEIESQKPVEIESQQPAEIEIQEPASIDDKHKYHGSPLVLEDYEIEPVKLIDLSQDGRHLKSHGHEKHHEKKHRKYDGSIRFLKFMRLLRVLVWALIAFHFYLIRCLKKSQEKFNALTGKKETNGCPTQ
jgi:hypothetical protein